MRQGRPSFTASAVAFCRGVAHVDPVAKDLLPPALALALRAGDVRERPWVAAAWNTLTFGLVDHVELRTRAIDRAVADGAAAGLAQLVILGAGLDARAHRLSALSGAVVFEVDHPSTQAYKREKVKGRAPIAREVRYVAVDFEKDALEDKLAGAGHRADVATFWIWEGVMPYLPPAASAATLDQVARRSAPKSRVAVTYGTPESTTLGAGFTAIARAGFRVIGEPLRGLVSAPAMAEALGARGFRVLEDTGPEAWPEATPTRRLYVLERLAVAERVSSVD
jgi:methyltransferase (TIGR00027 family)